MSFKLTILGCNSAVPSVERHPTAQLLNANERFFLIDCGEGTQVRLRQYQLNFQRINHIFISHLHGDHYFGLIGLICSMHLLGRNKDLHIYAHQQLKAIINLQLLASNTELNYPLFFHPISEDNDQVLYEDEKISISNVILDHTIKCSGFIFKEKKSKRKIIKDKIEQFNIPFDKYNGIKEGADWIADSGEVIKNKEITVENTPVHSYAFCTDTIYNEGLIEKIKGIDLLYHEATFKKDLADRAKETGHSTTYEAATIAKKSAVKNLLIGHFSKRYKNLDELLIESKVEFKNTYLAKSGLVLDFDNFYS
ncbi:MAG: Ribonuclease BN [Cryomorphaceae bacterium]|nr:MAG: Ribonuclease BN [Cryomorphaceae bacterium]